MLILTGSDIIQLITGSATSVDVHASYVDLLTTTGAVTPGRTQEEITTAATTTIVDAPAANTVRNVKFLSIRNRDTSANAITVKHNSGSSFTLMELSLPIDYAIVLDDTGKWTLYDAGGAQVTTALAGIYLKTTVLTSASANHTTDPRATRMYVRGVGGGGGGGGCTSVAAAAAAAGGGGSGAYAEKTFVVSPNTAYAYTCGAAGTGASGAAGNNGGNSTFVVGATTVTAFGGTGGPVATAATTLTARAGGAGGVVATNGDVNTTGRPGANGHVLIVAGPIVSSGAGGPGFFGGGGLGLVAVGNGNAAGGFGAGGGGAATGASAVRTGGNGTAGCWVVDEYT